MTKSWLKKVGVVVVAVMLLSLSMLALTACGDTEPENQEKKYTVTFLDGTTVIATEQVKEGEKAKDFAPADKNYKKEGFTFNGWFATVNFSHKFNFDTVITKDTNVYSQWVSAVQDVRAWTIAGESSAGGPLKAIGWNGGTQTEGPGANLLTKTADKNEFKLTINLYAGDAFQLCVQNAEGDWQENEAGVIMARGGKFLEANQYMSAASGGLGDGQTNIIVGQAGNYTLTLTTDAVDENVGKITVVRNGDAPAITIDRTSYTWYIYGASTAENSTSALGAMNWGNGYNTETGLIDAKPYSMKKVSDNDPDGTGTFVFTGRFDVGDQFLFSVLTVGDKKLNTESGTMFYFTEMTEFNGLAANFKKADGMGSNIEVVTAGYYTFTLTVTLKEGALKGAIEVEDNVSLLQNGNWIVMGNRLSYAQVTGTGEVKDGKLGKTMTQEEYDAYDSDVKGALNNFGKGEDENIAKLVKDSAASTGGVAVYKLTMKLDVGDYFYFAIPSWVYNVVDFGKDWYGTVNGMYNSTVVPGHVAAGTMPAGIAAVWTNNFVCLEKGSYDFVVTISATGTLSATVAVSAVA